MNFKKLWSKFGSDMSQDEYMIKSSQEALTEKEIKQAQQLIHDMQAKGFPANKIIAKLQRLNTKLVEKYRAERVFWTENKQRESNIIAEAGEELGIDEYRVILSPNACHKCRSVFNNGKRILTSKEIADGQVPPAITHPNCYCSLIPK